MKTLIDDPILNARLVLIAILVAVIMLLCGCDGQKPIVAVSTAPIHEEAKKVEKSIERATGDANKLAGEFHGNAEILDLQQALSDAKTQEATEEIEIGKWQSEYNKQLAQFEDIQKENADQKSKILALEKHLTSLRWIVAGAWITSALLIVLGPSLKSLAGPYGVLVPSGLAGLVVNAAGFVLAMGGLWIFQLIL